MSSPEEYEAAGLFNAEADGLTGRLELLDWLGSMGFTIDEMVDGLRREVLPALASDRRMMGDALVGRAEATAAAGVEPGLFDEYANALGFVRVHASPDSDLGFTAAEAEMFAVFGGLTSMFTPEESIGFVRVIGAALARVAEAGVTLFLADVESRMLELGGSEYEMARKGFEATGIIDGFMQMLDPALRRHLQQSTERFRRATISQEERFQYRYAVGFVDLVGFTERSASMSAKELASFLRDFEARAYDAVSDAGARVVKLIGDEVMFVGDDPDTVCRAATALMSGFDDGEETVVPRGGAAYGHVLTRGGDYFGAVVNLASRLVDEAVPQEILVTSDLAQAATSCSFEPAGRRMVKGFADPVAVFSLVG
jgi:adenylate cyclase